MYVGGLMAMFIQWILSAVALTVTAWVVPGFKLKDFSSALIAAIVVGLANIFIRPFLLFLAIPFNILTLGLFTFVVNAAVLKLCAAMLRGFEITSWFSAIFGAVILAIVSSVMTYFLF